MSAPQGPYLYDEGPAELHTGTPRRRRGTIAAVLGGTVLVAVGMAVALPLVTGTADEQARQSATVFIAALQAGDTDTARSLLCGDELARLPAGGVAAAYLRATPGEVVGTHRVDRDGRQLQQVTVRWADGSSSLVDVVNENGPHVCGTEPSP
jgi:hypothetical protein